MQLVSYLDSLHRPAGARSRSRSPWSSPRRTSATSRSTTPTPSPAPTPRPSGGSATPGCDATASSAPASPARAAGSSTQDGASASSRSASSPGESSSRSPGARACSAEPGARTVPMRVDQAIFTSLRRGGRAGYHVVSRSPGVSDADADGPGHVVPLARRPDRRRGQPDERQLPPAARRPARPLPDLRGAARVQRPGRAATLHARPDPRCLPAPDLGQPADRALSRRPGPGLLPLPTRPGADPPRGPPDRLVSQPLPEGLGGPHPRVEANRPPRVPRSSVPP